MRAVLLLAPLLLLGCAGSNTGDEFIDGVFGGEEPREVCARVSPDWKVEKGGKNFRRSCQEAVVSLQADYIPRALKTRIVSPGKSAAVVCYKVSSGYSLLILLLQERAGRISDLRISPDDLLPGERRAAERARSGLPDSCRDLPLD